MWHDWEHHNSYEMDLKVRLFWESSTVADVAFKYLPITAENHPVSSLRVMELYQSDTTNERLVKFALSFLATGNRSKCLESADSGFVLSSRPFPVFKWCNCQIHWFQQASFKQEMYKLLRSGRQCEGWYSSNWSQWLFEMFNLRTLCWYLWCRHLWKQSASNYLLTFSSRFYYRTIYPAALKTPKKKS